MTIPDRIEKMLSTEGFYELWCKEVGKGKTHEEAYKTLEAEFGEVIEEFGLKGIVGTKRYSSFNSFRVTNYYRIKNHQSTN